LTPQHFCACPKFAPGFPTPFVSWSFVFNDLRRAVVVCFVDIGVIVDRHCMTFFFNDMELSNFYCCPFRMKYLMEKQHISMFSL